ncbi:MAG TPA: YidC/Oxa1 family membrane protein insertase [Anaerolineae bacterium]|nr:YidC/Oxa1 family membrane protein insertase [Anaerolineae bacterium]
MGELFNEAIIRPMLNVLLLLSHVLWDQYWLAIIVFTIVMRLIMTPLMLPQQRSAKKMQELQPRLKELQAKYGKDREKMAQAQMALYKEAGVSPLGGCLPTLVQFPIWIGLYQSIIHSLGHQPLNLVALSQDIYLKWSWLWSDVPLNRFFLGMDLSLTPQQMGGLTYALPILVAFTMWLQSKMMTPAGAGDPQSQSMNQSMTTMMPLMFGFFSLSFSAGLSFYFIVSNIIGIISQGFISGWSGLRFWQGMSLSKLFGGGARAGAPRPSGTKDVEATTAKPQRGMSSGSSTTGKKKRRRKR